MAKTPIMGVHEIAHFLGVSRQRVNVIIHQDDFPKPCAELPAGRFWWTPDIEKYKKARNRKPGRYARRGK